ncbi:hypothetical protein ACIQAC_09910 [Streptomyces sp. NPDC088387]|uniref:hypothetical protein n=1 Tax=Streptomyces sp. NPDC088387 TaxID=3365859 RepID=UPI003803ABAD
MPPRPPYRPYPPRLRGALSAALIALACLLVPFGALAAWAVYGLADTGRYVGTMAPLAADPAVRDVVADTVGDGIAERADAGSMAPYLRDAVRSFTRTEAFRLGWDEANRATHHAILHALDSGSREPVVVDLAPVAAAVQRQLAEDNVPLGSGAVVGHTPVAVLPAQDLAPLRKGLHVLEFAAFWLPLAAVVLAVTGIALAACRRRAVTATALGTALGGALLGLAVALGRHLTLSDLPPGVPQDATAAVYDTLTTTLRTASWLLVALGLTAALTTHYTHRPEAKQQPFRGARNCARHPHPPAPEQPPLRGAGNCATSPHQPEGQPTTL